MPKWKSDYDGSSVAPSAGFGDYAGPTPPAGMYRFVVKRGTIGPNSNSDDMLTVILEIAEPPDSKSAKYNGYAVFWYGTFNEKNAARVNKFAQACGFAIPAIWRSIVLSRDETPIVLKVGAAKFPGVYLNIKTNKEEYPKESGEFRLRASDFFPAKASDEDPDDEDEDDVDQSMNDDDDDYDEDADDEGDDDEGDDDDDDEPEPEPPPRRAKKAAPAKKAAAPAKAAGGVKRKRPAPEPEADDDDDEDEDSF